MDRKATVARTPARRQSLVLASRIAAARRLFSEEGPLNRYTPEEMVRYWKTHYGVRGAIDWRTDPDGLNNVCQSGAPLAVNRYYHRSQKRAFLRLLAPLLPFEPPARALDVGCGAGRWSRLLAGSGLAVTGIDLQSDLIETNRARNPGIQFELCAVQDFTSPEPFDLVTSVTVLQHLPEEEQVKAIANLARLCRPGGHALILENVGDHSSPHVFPRAARDWVRLFEEAGFRRLAECPYDFSPAQRLYYRATKRQRLAHAGVEGAGKPPPSPESLEVHSESPRLRRLRSVDHLARIAACTVDAVIEPALISIGAPLATVHVGILFEKRE